MSLYNDHAQAAVNVSLKYDMAIQAAVINPKPQPVSDICGLWVRRAVNNLHYPEHHLLCRKLFLHRCITDALNIHSASQSHVSTSQSTIHLKFSKNMIMTNAFV